MNTKRELRVIIAGGRNFKDYDMLSREVSHIIESHMEYSEWTPENIRIVSGHAKGADEKGEEFATESGFNLTIFPANWLRFGKAAGCIRNQTMADYATEGDNIGLLIAFWNGTSRGTKDMITRAENLGMDVYIISYTE